MESLPDIRQGFPYDWVMWGSVFGVQLPRRGRTGALREKLPDGFRGIVELELQFTSSMMSGPWYPLIERISTGSPVVVRL
ncbi:hypothetical protein [Streptomyces tauricus]|uniref:hypothetical protein n=1 Tax=Streptomyces tauricus TaxID=68274 RepID=UPI0033A11382